MSTKMWKHEGKWRFMATLGKMRRAVLEVPFDADREEAQARMDGSYMVFDGVLKGGHHLVLRVAGEAEQKEFNGGTLVAGRGFHLLVKPVDAILHGVDEKGREVQVNWHAQPMGKAEVSEDKGGTN